jgi:hypothetical protein
MPSLLDEQDNLRKNTEPRNKRVKPRSEGNIFGCTTEFHRATYEPKDAGSYGFLE